MIPLLHLWLPILVSAVLVFVASSVVHMVFKWHNSDYRQLPNEEAVREVIRKGNPAPGQYVLPYCPDMKEMNTPEAQRKFAEGPVAMLYLKRSGMPNMGRPLLAWFLFTLVVSFVVAYLTSRTVLPPAPYLQVFRVAGTAAFLAYAGNAAQAAIWMGKPWRSAAKEMLDGLIYAVVTAGAFGWLWPH
ncbi:MAG: hypothetical protein IPN59_15020 [Holophaga sp.]|nr:hypothetical protein [Holophaga sp.]